LIQLYCFHLLVHQVLFFNLKQGNIAHLSFVKMRTIQTIIVK